MIDILAYELKYKNDDMVMELLRHTQESMAMADCESETIERLESEVDTLEGDVAGLEEKIDGYADDIDSLLDDLTEGDEEKKQLTIQGLENLVKEMRE